MTIRGEGPYLVICYASGYDTYVVRHETLAEAREGWEDAIANCANPIIVKELEIVIEDIEGEDEDNGETTI